MSEANVINVVIRLIPSGDELDVELPLFTTGKEIVDELLDADAAPRTDYQGNPYVYRLVSKATGKEVSPEKSLMDIGVREGDTLLLTPQLVAGAW
jgi:uncharacterized ubiquitin-like protein YukD